MQYDPSKAGYNNPDNMYVNQYPPVNQPQYGQGNAYPYVISYSQNIAVF
jgi:hypothetical protein